MIFKGERKLETFGRNKSIILTLFLLAIAVVTFLDMQSDLLAGGSYTHVAVEIAIICLSLVCVAWLWVKSFSLFNSEIKVSQERIKALEEEARDFKGRVSQVTPRLSQAIDEQFLKWQLTASESETARLVLKGLSNKEIAGVRSCSEQTVKQQTNAIYKKSGLTSRAQLAAFFLEDLF